MSVNRAPSEVIKDLRTRAEIRAKLRANGKRDPGPDRIAKLLEEAADVIEELVYEIRELT